MKAPQPFSRPTGETDEEAQLLGAAFSILTHRRCAAIVAIIAACKSREATRGGMNAGDLSSAEGTGKSLVQSITSAAVSRIFSMGADTHPIERPMRKEHGDENRHSGNAPLKIMIGDLVC
jgi:hypothetical protein